MTRDPHDEDATRPADATLPAGDSGTAVMVFWDGGYRRVPLIGAGTMRVGRGDECELRIDHPSVSRHHLCLHFGETISIEDMGSFNGSRLNGIVLRAHERRPIGLGDVVELGTALLVVQQGARASSPAADAGRDAMQRLERLIELVAQSRINALLVGETGTGKEVAAEAIHARSPRADKSFVCLNCAAVPETLLEAELFGFERGAFTGADRQKPGLIEAANGGTFFLDEVGELPLTTQAKLLRVLERRDVQRLGSVAPQKVDVRFIAATHRDLGSMVAEGGFRGDLLYRLNGITLTIPPLRERPHQIYELANDFAAAAALELGRPAPILSADVRRALEGYAWPGNIRELRNTIERAVLLAEGGPITVQHIQLSPSPSERGSLGRNALRRDYADFEREQILAALEKAGGNQTEAAAILGVSRRTLMNRLDALGLPRPRKRPSS